MSKGALTKAAILERALGLASRVGLEGLTVARLSDEVGLSKSGMFAHFGSKEALQVQALEAAARRFVDVVFSPALAAPRGEPRVRALFDRWLVWGEETSAEGGCLFVAAAVELDDRPGPARDRLVELQRDWLETIAGAVRLAVKEGHFRPGVDGRLFAFQTYGIALAYHHQARLLRDPAARARARQAFDALVAQARRPRTRTGARRSPTSRTK